MAADRMSGSPPHGRLPNLGVSAETPCENFTDPFRGNQRKGERVTDNAVPNGFGVVCSGIDIFSTPSFWDTSRVW